MDIYHIDGLIYQYQEIILLTGNRSYNAVITLVQSAKDMECMESYSLLDEMDTAYIKKIRNPVRKNDCILGRYAAKIASAHLLDTKIYNISIQKGIFNQPIVKSKAEINVDISLSHTKNYGVSIAYTEGMIMGIDIEDSSKKSSEFIYLSDYENRQIERLRIDRFVVWTTREALLKCLKLGICFPQKILELSKIKIEKDLVYGKFKNFPQYIFQVFSNRGKTVAVVYPSNVILNIDWHSFEILK